MAKTKAVALPAPEAVIASFVAKQGADADGLLDLIREADRGNEQALSHLRVIYAAMPEIASSLSSWQSSVEQTILQIDQPGVTATFTEQANRWRKKLAGDNPAPLEELLVNRVIIDHLHALSSEQTLQKKMNESLPLAVADFYQKQAERAQRRLLRSIKTLAEVRKLLRPAVQVNIAEQQVNVAGDVRTGKNGNLT